MKVSFKQDATMQPDDLQVYVKAAQLSPAVLQILQQIQQLADSHATLPLLVGERGIVLPTNEVGAIEVYGDQLPVHTRQEVYQSRGQLKYQRWIESYSGAANADDQQAAVALVNRLYDHSTSAEQQQMLTAFRISTQMEYSFWEMAYHLEKWPEGSRNNDAKSR